MFKAAALQGAPVEYQSRGKVPSACAAIRAPRASPSLCQKCRAAAPPELRPTLRHARRRAQDARATLRDLAGESSCRQSCVFPRMTAAFSPTHLLGFIA